MLKILLIIFSFHFHTLINITKNVKSHADISDSTRKISQKQYLPKLDTASCITCWKSLILCFIPDSSKHCNTIAFLYTFAYIFKWKLNSLMSILNLLLQFNTISTQIPLIDLDPIGSSTVMQDLSTGAHDVITLSSKNKDKTSNKIFL